MSTYGQINWYYTNLLGNLDIHIFNQTSVFCRQFEVPLYRGDVAATEISKIDQSYNMKIIARGYFVDEEFKTNAADSSALLDKCETIQIFTKPLIRSPSDFVSG